MNRKTKEQVLNKAGILTIDQIKKIKLIAKLIKKLPVVDEQMRAKQDHQLTIQEFKAVHARKIIEEVAPEFVDKSIKDIFDSATAVPLERKLKEILVTARDKYFDIIMIALEKKLPGIPDETIDEIRFKDHFFRPTRSYLYFYRERYKYIL
jgi:hypothetical protein